MTPKSAVVHSDPEILGGTPVFVGTRVPVKSLYDYLEAGDSLDEFLDSFPSVTREQAVAALERVGAFHDRGACGCCSMSVFRTHSSVNFARTTRTMSSMKVGRQSETANF